MIYLKHEDVKSHFPGFFCGEKRWTQFAFMMFDG